MALLVTQALPVDVDPVVNTMTPGCATTPFTDALTPAPVPETTELKPPSPSVVEGTVKKSV